MVDLSFLENMLFAPTWCTQGKNDDAQQEQFVRVLQEETFPDLFYENRCKVLYLTSLLYEYINLAIHE